MIGLVDLAERTAWAFSAKQTPARKAGAADLKEASNASGDSDGERTRIDDYVDHVRQAKPYLPAGVGCVLADAFYAKKKFVDGMIAQGLDVTSKLRLDANLSYLYEGPQKPRGRKRVYAGKVGLTNLTGFEDAGTLGNLRLFTQLVRHESLKRTIRVVLLQSTTRGQQGASGVAVQHRCEPHCARDCRAVYCALPV